MLDVFLDAFGHQCRSIFEDFTNEKKPIEEKVQKLEIDEKKTKPIKPDTSIVLPTPEDSTSTISENSPSTRNHHKPRHKTKYNQ